MAEVQVVVCTQSHFGENILVYVPVGGSQAVCPYSAITNNSMFFDTVESEFISLVYHQSGSPYLSLSKGSDDGSPHGIYNHFGQLTIDELLLIGSHDSLVNTGTTERRRGQSAITPFDIRNGVIRTEKG